MLADTAASALGVEGELSWQVPALSLPEDGYRAENFPGSVQTRSPA